ncbi:MAG: J domain-containing protein [Chloroflexota bacterium]
MAPVHDPYKALGVARAATKAEIKAAHRKLAKRHHPDKAQGDGRKFLEVQEAYRVLSDPLLRREWDEKHAPGPVRARDVAQPARPRAQPKPETRQRPPRAPRRAAAPRDEAATAREEAAQPRSSRAYTWSAADVPWWEEGVKRAEARSARSRSAKAESASAQSEPAATAAPDFEVYNRSSGAAWSMAARKYFRKGDSDLPSRGVFRHEGGMPVTAGRARAAAQAEARRATDADGAQSAKDAPTPGDHRPTGKNK